MEQQSHAPRRKTVVHGRLQYLFAGQLLIVQVIVALTIHSGVQLKINSHIMDAASIEAATAMEALARDLTMVVLGITAATGGLVFALALWLSNRIVGPIPRLRRALKALAAGDYSVRLNFRPGDTLEEIAYDVNDLALALRKRDEGKANSEPSETQAGAAPRPEEALQS